MNPLENLLKSTPVKVDHMAISAALRGRVVLITGAAGSIGSELCRRIARFHPAAIVGFDIAESPLFQLDLEMSRDFPQGAFKPEIGSIQNPARLRDLFETHHPSVVLHAAAYKHVPLMEAHPFEAIENNVFGTRNLATMARDFDVATFVMISSDKAVRPSSIMGATKRIAELIVQSCQFTSVRFGNVLESSGSVIPIFREQIARGGPVTVTDPEMRRYFLTAPDACQLVLQASAMADGGEIFTLEMGDPVRITDLTNDLIRRSGREIQIEFTGPRPGEKLREEIIGPGESILPTPHERIRIASGEPTSKPRLERDLNALREGSIERDLSAAVDAIQDLVPDYTPTEQILRQHVARPMLAASGVAAG